MDRLLAGLPSCSVLLLNPFKWQFQTLDYDSLGPGVSFRRSIDISGAPEGAPRGGLPARRVQMRSGTPWRKGGR